MSHSVNAIDVVDNPETGWDEEVSRLRKEEPEEIVLVPGSKGLLRIGLDDSEIKREHFLNLSELEEEDAEHEQFYVATVETTLKHPTYHLEQSVNVPHNIIIAKTMRQAIEMFENENSPRFWIPWDANSRFRLQLGIGRVARQHAMVRIEKVRKDCVLHGQGNWAHRF
jgi:hypothetical protein